ncbi:helix-turn-helix transcriptional regulator [Staphylococcus cohnii]|uniref:Helix-turn-helix transcriptional regulator n=2 Tax=Staphylococcus cohnii TaxID=29382 RepID=A0ABT6IYZ3_9STAP|nr:MULTISPECIES: helix-turn-helix transcriptional regulator [Staphylococcus]TGP62508.1 transcriptional regulator [bacterium M00.F.Ca.ET.229.01.1.1]TGS39341.1 transcriptional regulator [bacterium M00.F.Ca.ET.180.01.1.1]AYX90875.1 transcriptional regulator [Staphylococcus cohnii]KKI65291.1 Transcriptional regulator, PBSX family [Staphylococcus cohnii subsp. cohnii]MBZ8172033.1 helix-turn-helix transcriptional regulator [Staphylococcus cohnii]
MNKVKHFRSQQQISQLALARSVGVSRQTINMIENDKYNPSLNLCINIAQSLNVTLNDLFWEDHNDEEKR